MALKSIPQRGWLRGLNASISYASSPKGVLARVSNFLYTQRGGLVSFDQNLGFVTLNRAGPSSTPQGTFLDLILFNKLLTHGNGQPDYRIYALIQNFATGLTDLVFSAPGGPFGAFGYSLTSGIPTFPHTTIGEDNYAGMPGEISPIPQMVPFAQNFIIVLGNQITPYIAGLSAPTPL